MPAFALLKLAAGALTNLQVVHIVFDAARICRGVGHDGHLRAVFQSGAIDHVVRLWHRESVVVQQQPPAPDNWGCCHICKGAMHDVNVFQISQMLFIYS